MFVFVISRRSALLATGETAVFKPLINKTIKTYYLNIYFISTSTSESSNRGFVRLYGKNTVQPFYENVEFCFAKYEKMAVRKAFASTL